MATLNGLPTGDLLNPGGDFSATVVQTVFPYIQQPNNVVGQAQTVLGTALSYVSWPTLSLMVIVATIGMIYRFYRLGRTGQFEARSSGMMPIKFALAFLLAIPNPATGISLAQSLIGYAATWGAGLASHEFQAIIKGIGPSALPISKPIIPQTETTIAAIVQSELCRSLINYAANNQDLVPEPAAETGANAGGDGFITWAYRLSGGNATDAPVCGVVTLHQATPAGPAVVDLTPQRRAILTGVIANIHTAVDPIAKGLWTSRDFNTLMPLQAIVIQQANTYSAQLSSAVTTATQQLRSDFPINSMQNGSIGQPDGFGMMSAMGWMFAPAWYVEMSRLEGQNMAALVATPLVAGPTYQGLGRLLSADVAPLLTSAMAYMNEVMAYVATQDRMSAPTGYGDLSSIRTPSTDGAGMLERISRSLGFTDSLLRLGLQQISPTSTSIVDPFGSLMGLGQWMINTALAAYGTSIILSSSVGSAASTVAAALTGNFTGAIAVQVAHSAMSAAGGAVFFGIMSLLVPGVIINYILPNVPILVWAFGIANWLIRIIVMTAGASIWMFGHVTMSDDSLAGRGIRGWMELAAIFLQPTFMLFGLMASYTIFAVLVFLLTTMFYISAGLVLGGGWLLSNLIGMVAILCVFVLALVSCAVWSFSLIAVIPEKLFELLGGVQTYIDSHSVAHDMALVGSMQALRNTSTAVERIANDLTSRMAPQQEESRNNPNLGIESSSTV